MSVFIIFLVLTLVFAVICGKAGKDKEKIFVIFRTIFALTSMIGLIVAMGPNRSSSGTEMTVALNKITGGWSDTILVGLLFGGALNIASIGISAVTRNRITAKKKLILPRIVIVLLLGLFGTLFIVNETSLCIKLIIYAIKPDGIHHVKWDNSMIVKSIGKEPIGITYTVGILYVWHKILISLAFCIFFIVSLISLIKAIKHNRKKIEAKL
jgi:hypothetical protein